jgi:hypothetical protein
MNIKTITLAIFLGLTNCASTTTVAPTPKKEMAPEGWKFVEPNKNAKYTVPVSWTKVKNGYDAPGKIAFSRYFMSSKIKDANYASYVEELTNDFVTHGYELLFAKKSTDSHTYLLLLKNETEYLTLLINNKNSKTHHLGCGGKLYLSKQTLPFCNTVLSSFSAR